MAQRPPANPHHPAPHRARTSRLTLLLGLFGAPAAWVALMAVAVVVSSHACYPQAMPLAAPRWPHLEGGLMVAGIACLLLSLASSAVALKAWRETRHELNADKKDALDQGIGRTRFLAVMGLMGSGLFVIAILLTLVALAVVPACRPW